MTSHNSIRHRAYFLQRSFTPDNRHLIFTSFRVGGAQIASDRSGTTQVYVVEPGSSNLA
jgi:Tol biopolymer transport system component